LFALDTVDSDVGAKFPHVVQSSPLNQNRDINDFVNLLHMKFIVED